MRSLRLPAALALAALGLVGLAPAASAADAATLSSIAKPLEFSSSLDGTVPVDYACTVPTTARDALTVRVVEEWQATTIVFTGSAPVTCDGTRRTVVVDLAHQGDSSVGPGAQPGLFTRAQISLQGTRIDQVVSIVRTDGDPVPPPVVPSIVVVGDVVFSTPTQGSVTLDVGCNSWATGVAVTVQGEAKASGEAGIACAAEHTLTVPLTAEGPGFAAGTQTVELRAELENDELTLVTEVDLRQGTPPAPAKAAVSLTANASPEKITKGKKITVTGKVRRDGKKVRLKAALEFRPDGGDYAEVKAVTSSRKGVLRTTVKARRSGSFRYTYAGNATTQAGASAEDHVVVTPKPKAYKTCAALVKVYAHGVGRPGARDKGGDVTDFTRDTRTYAKNKKHDPDKDGIACER